MLRRAFPTVRNRSLLFFPANGLFSSPHALVKRPGFPRTPTYLLLLFVLLELFKLRGAGAHMKKVRHSIDAQHFPKPATTLPKAVLVIVHGDVIYRRHRVLRTLEGSSLAGPGQAAFFMDECPLVTRRRCVGASILMTASLMVQTTTTVGDQRHSQLFIDSSAPVYAKVQLRSLMAAHSFFQSIIAALSS
ncbi:unnamed protein product [Heligmosomoides polygyrus]|uniref:Uncharacterized protein n=1 Tax=Heligmosomoides polygyrus TaxID=6339 RepID=A0A183G4P2_HELPZ|nr:unnamed protein product [Heligmosomoides polygyrus]